MFAQIKPKKFPREGAWCVVAGALAVIFALGRQDTEIVEEPNPNFGKPGQKKTVNKPVVFADEPFAEVHFVDTSDAPKHGETRDIQKNVPLADIRQATFDEIRQTKRAAHVTELHARRLGHALTDEQHAIANAQLDEHIELARVNAALSEHPDVIALDEQIAQERARFEGEAEARRAAAIAAVETPTT
jgi:hypothetical protein